MRSPVLRSPVLLWVDARLDQTKPSYLEQLKLNGKKYTSENIAHSITMIDRYKPDIIVFDFDFADITGLKSLQRIREKSPHTPVLMLVEQHYERLTIWALRCRVWDYLIKPIDINQLNNKIETLGSQYLNNDDTLWCNTIAVNKIPNEASIIGNSSKCYSTYTAISYMEEHLHEKISAEDVSRKCGLTRYELSRAFKSEHNMTFRDFLLHLRMTRAHEMLTHTDANITEISLSVGINDLSQFIRQFHKIYGCSPGNYRRKNKTLEKHLNKSYLNATGDKQINY